MVNFQTVTNVKVNRPEVRTSESSYRNRPPLKDRAVLAAVRRVPTASPPDGGSLPLIRPYWNRLPLPSRILLAGFAVYVAFLGFVAACVELARLA